MDIFPAARPVTAHDKARGTQDVNDPFGPRRRPCTGSFTSWVPFLRESRPWSGRRRTPPQVFRAAIAQLPTRRTWSRGRLRQRML